MEYVYIFTEYSYGTYSYNGVVEDNRTVYKTMQGALAHGKRKNLKIVEYVNDPSKEATIEKYNLND